jgi:hypothetical protein
VRPAAILSCPRSDYVRLSNAYRRDELKKRRFAAANRRLPVDFKALIRRRSRLAVMHANNDSLSVRSASVSGSDTEGRPYGVRQLAKTGFLHLATFKLWALFLRSVHRVMAVLWIKSPHAASTPHGSSAGLLATGRNRHKSAAAVLCGF